MLFSPEDIQIRRPTMDDVSAVLGLMLARDHAEYGEANMTEEHIRNFWQAPDFNMATDAWVVTRPDGHMIGYASIWHQQYRRVYTYFTVLPEYHSLQIKNHVLDLVERRAQEFLVESSADFRVTLGTEIADLNQADQHLLVQRGYSQVRGTWRMAIEMCEAPHHAVWPQGIRVRPCLPEHDAHAIFEVQEEAFADHWGYTPLSFEQWEHFTMKQENFDPSLWFLACEGETINQWC